MLDSIAIILREVGNLKRIGEQYSAQDSGMLSIATTHTQARYVLPVPVAKLRERYPKVNISLHQGAPDQVARMVIEETAEIGMATESLANYPDFHRVVPAEDGVWRMPDARLARRHRSNIGTIVSDASMQVQFVSGGKLGSVEESFIARLKPGDVFMFAGRLLELVRTQQMTAYVRTAPKGSAALPRWNGRL